MFEDRFGYHEALPLEIREIFMWLCQDLTSLHGKWNLYLGLFSEEEQTRLLSTLAKASFNIIEESLRSDMTMAICRLSDPPRSVGNDNLSMKVLSQHCAGIPDFNQLLDDFQDACEPARKYRHKRVGHNDLNTIIRPINNPLPGIGRRQIDTILRLGASLLNTVFHNYTDSELFFQPIQYGGPDELLFWLRTAKKYQESNQ